MSELAPPAGSIFVLGYYVWGELKNSRSVRLDPAARTFAELRDAVGKVMDELVIVGGIRGDRGLVHMVVVHPDQLVPCHFAQAIYVPMALTRREYADKVRGLILAFLDECEAFVRAEHAKPVAAEPVVH